MTDEIAFYCIAALCENARKLFCDSSSAPASKVRDSGTVTVQLLSREGVVVGVGTIESGFKTGMVLHDRKLFPSEAAVRVSSVVDATAWTSETYHERLGSCMGLVIRWKWSLLRTIESGCLQMEGSTSSPLKATNLEKSPQCGPHPIPPWNRGVYPAFATNVPILPMLGWGSTPTIPPLPPQPNPPKPTVETEERINPQLPRNEGLPGLPGNGLPRNEGSPLLPKNEARHTRKKKQKMNLEDLTQDEIQLVKQGGQWKDHWVMHLIKIRGELSSLFSAPPKQGTGSPSPNFLLKFIDMRFFT